MNEARERTTALIGRQLGLDLSERVGDAYRDASGELLEGEWLGAFAQPSVVLDKVSVMSLQIDGATGSSVDEYGEATLQVAIGKPERVAWTKRYASGARFEYIGRISGDTLAGYWFSSQRPSFAGVFWLARADRLPAPSADQLRARVRRTSPRRAVLKALAAVFALAGVLSARAYPPLLFVLLAVAVGFTALLRQRSGVLQREVELWKRQLS